MDRARIMLGLLAAFILFSSLEAQRPQQSTSAPKLILVVSVDQMRYDYLPRFKDLYKGGFRRLLDRGAVFTNAKYRHALNETGPGYAVLLSGRHPSHSGILANQWYDPLLKKVINVVDDPVHAPVGGAGRGASPVNFVGFTLGDALKLKTPESHIVGVSLKDRSAILMAGYRAEGAYWFENAGGNFITSTYYASEAPEWLVRWNVQRLPDKYAAKTWSRLIDGEAVYKEHAGRDDMPGEAENRYASFPHAFRTAPPSPAYYEELRRTPFSDEMTLSFTTDAMKAHRLGTDSITDILAIGFSATDYIGHYYSPDSHEIMDQLLRLDGILDELFRHIDRTVGLENTLVVLSADHGVTPIPEVLQAKGVAAQRAQTATLVNAARNALAARYPGINGLIADFTVGYYQVYFDEDVIRENNLPLPEIEETVSKALLATGLIDKIYSRADLMTVGDTLDPYLQLYRNTFFAPRGGHLWLLPQKYVTFRVSGAAHGTPYDDDSHVPIVFMGAGIKPGTYSERCGPEDIAPTLAKILGLNFPKEFDSRLLSEMLR